ncbi:DUF2878 domain-containing protein (plasmid) [Photobacterium sp. DA100]|uniref:DUF2878 domain-containing protein n=1 Tax=Photobacterium sp. DA100 TaxID=3027472 RepID=UPI002478F790|nr:DUF2878 domain-containing protein [Photobacterium sp. DA100]WEM45666.1 DUF2878 domain-containing protein [Photobacterium sp. DA100]
MMSGYKLILAGLLFNVYWLIAVLGQQAYVWLLVLSFLACWWIFPKVGRYAFLIAGAGVLMDGILSASNVLAFPSALLPFWLVMLWLGFGCFVWFMRDLVKQHPIHLISLIGGVGGALSYFAGYRLQAVEWPLGAGLTLVILFASWVFFSLLLARMLQRSASCSA